MKHEERKYSVAEIDRMRTAVSDINWWREAHSEDQLRTYMLNGTTPEELESAAKDARAGREAQMELVRAINEK